jgi:hypothetical protein
MCITLFLCHSLHNFFSCSFLFRNLIVISTWLQCRPRKKSEKQFCASIFFPAQIVRNSQRAQCAATSWTNRWMWRSSAVAIHCDNQAELKKGTVWANYRFLNVKPGGVYTDHWSLSAYKIYCRGFDLFGVSDVRQTYAAKCTREIQIKSLKVQ